MGQGGGNVGWQFNASMCASNKESGQPDNNKKLSTFCNNESCAIAYLLSKFLSINYIDCTSIGPAVRIVAQLIIVHLLQVTVFLPMKTGYTSLVLI